MIWSKKIDNRKREILILGKGRMQGLEHTRSDEKIYTIDFTEKNKIYCLSLHYNKENSCLKKTYLLMAPKLLNLNQKILNTLCLGNIKRDWPVDNIKKTRLDG